MLPRGIFFCSQKENDDKKVTIRDNTTIFKADAAELEVATKILENMELVGDRYVFTLTRDEPCGKYLPFENLEECRE